MSRSFLNFTDIALKMMKRKRNVGREALTSPLRIEQRRDPSAKRGLRMTVGEGGIEPVQRGSARLGAGETPALRFYAAVPS
jgi:hypothetical protein